MITFPILEIETYLRDLMKFNPFDSVVILKQLDDGQLSVEMANSNASVLFHTPFKKGMDAKVFFQGTDWEKFKNMLQHPAEEAELLSIQGHSKQVSVYIEPINTQHEKYFAMIVKQQTAKENFLSLHTYKNENTGLLNKRALNIKWSEHYQNFHDLRQISLLLVDLDRFKKYNESLGNHRADEMIKQISERFYQIQDESCELFHYSGDEFVFLVRSMLREEIELVVHKIYDQLKEPFLIEDQEYFVTCSIGISTISGEQSRSLDTLLHQAEQALFYVKKHGRAHYRFYREEMSHTFQNEVLMEAHLKRAIELNELCIHLQPQIDFDTYEIDSFEALMRWNNPKFGFVPPSQFIPIAESSGLIIQIGDWILEEVCRYQKEWKERGYRPVRIAVNISPKQFKQEDFAEKVKRVILKHKVEPQFIELEITESSMVNVEETEAILKSLKELGVFVSVDDFGTGYSSLSYLKKYPIDIIKIDQSFIADLNKDDKNEAIVKAIIALSHNLEMDVIAEGVEDVSQETFLKLHQCKKGQGYLYNKPLPVEEIVKTYFMN